MPKTETPLEMSARHVREGQERVARQEEIVAEMRVDDHPEAAKRGRRLLGILRTTLKIARADLRRRLRRDAESEFESRR